MTPTNFVPTSLPLAILFLAHYASGEPPELTRTRTAYTAELARVSEPVVTKYRAYLESQKAASAKAGKLDDVKAYDEELQLLAADDASARSKKISSSERARLSKRLSDTMWDVADDQGERFFFTRDGTFFRIKGPRDKPETNGTSQWKILDDGTVWVSRFGHNYLFSFPTDTEGLFSDGKFAEDGSPIHGAQTKLTLIPGERLPRNLNRK